MAQDQTSFDARIATPAIRFEANGYDTSGPRLMGRQAAGATFLRALVAGRAPGQPVVGFGPRPASGEALARLVREIDPSAETRWLRSSDLAALAASGVCHLPHASLRLESRLRLRAGPAAFCLTGVTHTTASHGSVASVAAMASDPIMPWDALICTSASVLATVDEILAAKADYLRWRFGPAIEIRRPELPVIPLGVHCADFVFEESERAAARAALALDDEEVAALFVGRLSLSGKAHPAAMMRGLQQASASTGRRVTLILCGWAANAAISEAHRSAAARFCPDVRLIELDGRETVARSRAWAAADLFVSLSDNIQETFGLTPLEAMAAGLPAVVSDWDGYRTTVRNEVDGFRIPTWAPGPGSGGHLAAWHEAGELSYDEYIWGAATATSVDERILVERLVALITQPDLRRTMGAAGRRRAREAFDWSVLYRQYQDLWTELNTRRLRYVARSDDTLRLAAAPRVSPEAQDPFLLFGEYPSHQIGDNTRISLVESIDAGRPIAADDPHFPKMPLASAGPVLARLPGGAASAAEIANATGLSRVVVQVTCGALAKLGLVRLGPE